MLATVTYIHHSSFVLELAEKTFLFDYPADHHLPGAAAEVLQGKIQGSDLFVFVSHSHDDHFNKSLARIAAPAASVRLVCSDDVFDLYPESVPKDALIVEPDESYPLAADLSVDTLLANDLGVAFIIQVAGIRVYFGGDLAEWVWPDMSDDEVRFTEKFFQKAIDRVNARPVHIAFQNVDKRLDNLAGGMKFLSQVQPQVFVPMHAFGDAAWYADLDYPCDTAQTRVFMYRNPGDSQVFELDTVQEDRT